MSSVSVLSNALRLRRFRRPETVQEILHPPVKERVGQYAYLVAVAVVALAIGGTLTAVSRMDFAERGMNGTLAWMQTTGMPMRPAMSQDDDRRGPSDRGRRGRARRAAARARHDPPRRADDGHRDRGRRRDR